MNWELKCWIKKTTKKLSGLDGDEAGISKNINFKQNRGIVQTRENKIHFKKKKIVSIYAP